MSNLSYTVFVLSILGIAFTGVPCRSQELEPRAYANTPIGLNFAIVGYTYNEGGAVVDPSIPIENAKLRIHAAVLAYVRSFAMGGRSAKLDIVAPHAWLSGAADVAGQSRERNVSGWGDLRLRVSVNLLGAPALSLEQMPTYRQDLIVGASLQVWAPTGRYDADKLVNLGTNRWAVKPELGVSKAIGLWTFEFAAAAEFFETNGRYLTDRTREQQPIYSTQGAVIRSLGSGIWMALGGTYYRGGRTTVDGVRGNDLQSNSRAGVILTFPVNRRESVKLYANTGVSTRTGSNFDSVGIAWQYRWGE